jgi:hypothetical protein
MNEFGTLKTTSILAFERLIGNVLPLSYLDFLKVNNGGSVDKGYFKLSIKDEDVSRIDQFYGLHEGPEHTRLDECYKVFKDRIPKCYVPIASDPFGNQICLLLTGPRSESIWFWDHETSELTKLADNITQFYQGLNSDLLPSASGIDEIIESNNIEQLSVLISEEKLDIHAIDDHGRTILENATIMNKPDIVRLLFDAGADLRDAKKLAEKNYKYFPEHKLVIDLIDQLSKLD